VVYFRLFPRKQKRLTLSSSFLLQGMAWLCKAWRGMAWQGSVGRGTAGQGKDSYTIPLSVLYSINKIEWCLIMAIASPIPMKDPADYIDFEEAELILSKTMHDLRDKAIIGLLWRCGLRAFEVGRIQKKHILPGENVIIIYGKGDHLDRMPVEPELFSWLIELSQNYSPDDYIICGFGKATGITRTTIWRLVDKYSKEAGITLTKSNRKMHPHAFRHSLAIWLVKKGVPIAKVSQILRHRSLVPTTFYLQFSAKELSEDYQRVWQEAKKG